MVNPEIVMLLLLEIEKPRLPPLISTSGLAVNVTPEFAGFTDVPAYVPALTCTVSPDSAVFAAAAIVQNGCPDVPGPVSEHDGFVLSTTYVLAAEAKSPVSAVPTSTVAPRTIHR